MIEICIMLDELKMTTYLIYLKSSIRDVLTIILLIYLKLFEFEDIINMNQFFKLIIIVVIRILSLFCKI